MYYPDDNVPYFVRDSIRYLTEHKFEENILRGGSKSSADYGTAIDLINAKTKPAIFYNTETASDILNTFIFELKNPLLPVPVPVPIHALDDTGYWVRIMVKLGSLEHDLAKELFSFYHEVDLAIGHPPDKPGVAAVLWTHLLKHDWTGDKRRNREKIAIINSASMAIRFLLDNYCEIFRRSDEIRH